MMTETLCPAWTPQTVPGTLDAGTGAPLDVRPLREKGYDFTRDVGAAWTGTLEGSVAGQNWTLIAALAASAQGPIDAHYNFVRLNISISGALGATTLLRVAGKIG